MAINYNTTLCGLDEAGRGPLAGPLLAAAVVFSPEFDFAVRFPELRFGDSKQMTRLQRERAFEKIIENAVAWQVETISVDEINQSGIGWANREAFERLITRLPADTYIVDGNLKLDLPPLWWGRVECRIRADESVMAVSAASILAKVTRDRLMHDLSREYPEYGWAHNSGYGTPEHLRALRRHGATVQHRMQFIQTALSKPLPMLDRIDVSE